jgi:hypothetical protein
MSRLPTMGERGRTFAFADLTLDHASESYERAVKLKGARSRNQKAASNIGL